MTSTVRVLLVEDSPDDAELLRLELHRAGFNLACERVETPEEMRAALEAGPWDIILSDYTLPQFSAQAALALAKQVVPDVPFLVVSGTIGEEAAVEAMRVGASDYVLKKSLARLALAVSRELREAEARKERRRAEQAAFRLAAVVQSSEDAIIALTLDSIIADWNPAAERLYGYAAAEVVGRHIALLVPSDKSEEFAGIMARLKRSERTAPFETVRLRKDGSPVHVSVTISAIQDERGRVVGASSIARDITARKLAERQLAESHRRFEQTLDAVSDLFVAFDRQWNYTYLNRKAAAFTGHQPGDLLGKNVWELFPAAVGGTFHSELLAANASGTVRQFEGFYPDAGRWYEHRAYPHPQGLSLFSTDITERKRQEMIAREQVRLAAFGRDVGLAVAHAGTLAEMLNRCTAAMVEHLDAAFARVWTVSEAGDVLQLQASSGLYTHLNGPHSRVPVGQYKIGLIASTRQPHLSNTVPDDPSVNDPEWARREGMVAFAGYPLVVEARLVGVMAMFARRPLSDATVEGMAAIAHAVALGVERWRATDALRAGEEQLRQDAMLLASVRDSVIVTDLDGIVTYWNEGATRLFGWTAEEMFGRPYADRIPDPVARSFVADQIKARAGGTEWAGEYQDYRKDGSRVWIDARAARITDAAGRPLGILGVAHDITDRKRTEVERDRLLGQLTLQIERMPLGYLLTDPDFRYTRWNLAAERIFGFTEAEVLGKHPFEVVVPRQSQPLVSDLFGRLRAGDMNAHGVCENVTKDGRTITCEWYNTPLLDEGGTFLGLLSLALDITEKRSLEEQFRQAQKMEAVGRLAGGVAHDFNNLLTIINGYGEIVMNSLPAGNSARELVREITNAGERAAGLTRQLLAFSRKTVLEPKVLDLNALIREMASLLRRLIGEDIQLATSLDPDLGRVKADAGQLEQALINLCVNARDAMPQGGKITVETHNADLEESYAREHADVQPGSHVLLAVRDTGHGMEAATRARIFEPFFTTKEQGKGTGLGLAMVFGFVKQSGGHIVVDSEPGKGAAFKLYLPQAQGAISSGKSHPGLSLVPGGAETLLLVEDEAGVRALARHVLQSCGYTVLEAGDGREALRAAEQHSGPVHLLVTDVVMPHLGGRQVSEAVLALHPEAKVLFLSGYTDDAVVRHGVLEANTNFLQKPFAPAALAQKVREVLDQGAEVL